MLLINVVTAIVKCVSSVASNVALRGFDAGQVTVTGYVLAGVANVLLLTSLVQVFRKQRSEVLSPEQIATDDEALRRIVENRLLGRRDSSNHV